MQVIDPSRCRKCRVCLENCPVAAIRQDDGKSFPFVLEEICVDCGLCSKVCDSGAVTAGPERGREERIMCRSCPVHCRIPPGRTGACRRFIHRDGELKRTRPLWVPRFKNLEERRRLVAIQQPLLTGIGAGTLYPDPKPTPYVVQKMREEIDVVTAVTEAPLTFSGIKVKIDTDRYIGEERARILRKGQEVGHVTTEEYGSKMLSLGGANLLTGKSGVAAARTIVDIANQDQVELQVEQGKNLEIQVGKSPVIDGVLAQKMRPACGSQVGSLSWVFRGLVDELLILDAAITGLMTEHAGSEEAGFPPSGITPVGRKSTPGRYLGEKGEGWGGTSVRHPREAIRHIDRKIAWPGMRILITEPNMERIALFTLRGDGELEEIPLTDPIREVIGRIKERSEPSRVSALYVGGLGGGVRRSLSRDFPLRVSRAIGEGRIVVTMGGGPVFILPGGGITIFVDVEKVPGKPFTWIPTPCTVAPLEFTMERETFDQIGGYPGVIRPLSAILAERDHESEP